MKTTTEIKVADNSCLPSTCTHTHTLEIYTLNSIFCFCRVQKPSFVIYAIHIFWRRRRRPTERRNYLEGERCFTCSTPFYCCCCCCCRFFVHFSFAALFLLESASSRLAEDRHIQRTRTLKLLSRNKFAHRAEKFRLFLFIIIVCVFFQTDENKKIGNNQI